jgi:hypothetical protein
MKALILSLKCTTLTTPKFCPRRLTQVHGKELIY